jgi:hypothetical protein
MPDEFASNFLALRGMNLWITTRLTVTGISDFCVAAFRCQMLKEQNCRRCLVMVSELLVLKEEALLLVMEGCINLWWQVFSLSPSEMPSGQSILQIEASVSALKLPEEGQFVSSPTAGLKEIMQTSTYGSADCSHTPSLRIFLDVHRGGLCIEKITLSLRWSLILDDPHNRWT